MLKEYNFESQFFLHDNFKQHYIDEGEGSVLLLVHGNPTWSYYYRNLIKHFKKTMRVIAPDHMGMGLSDKPQNYNYCLESHVTNLEHLIKSLDLKSIHLVVHDWGGAIGLSQVVKNIDRFKTITLLNTAAFPDENIPARINFLKAWRIGEWLIRRLNLFAWPATFMTTVKPLSDETKAAYLAPYNNYENRVAINSFVQDIPMNTSHKTYKPLSELEKSLKHIHLPVQVLWGARDFCFTPHFAKRFLDIWPHAKVRVFPDAGHYVLEDKIDDVIHEMEAFFESHS